MEDDGRHRAAAHGVLEAVLKVIDHVGDLVDGRLPRVHHGLDDVLTRFYDRFHHVEPDVVEAA